MDAHSSNATVQTCFTSISFVRGSPSQAFTINGIVALVVNGILAVTGTLVNSLVILTFWKSPNLRKKIPFFLIMMLSIADLAVGVFVHPLFILAWTRQLSGMGDCTSKTAYIVATTLFPSFSAMTQCVINIERYLAIVHPFVYERRVTKGNVFAATLFLCSLSTPATITLFFDAKMQSKIAMFNVTAVCLTTIVVYARIYQIARQKRRMVPKPSMLSAERSPHERSAASLDCGQTTAAGKREKLREFIKDIKLANTFILIVVSAQVCYFPCAVYNLYVYLNKSPALTVPLMMTGTWALTFSTIISSLNSLIFFWKNSRLRTEMLRMVRGAWLKA